MGQKTNAYGYRLQTNKNWKSRWFSEGDQYIENLHQDIEIRQYLKEELRGAGVINVEIERTSKKVDVNLYVTRPGLVIGKGGERINGIKDKIRDIIDEKVKLQVNVQQVRKTNLSARLVAEDIAQQLERRGSYKRAMSIAIDKSMSSSRVAGIRIAISGRLYGVRIARTEKQSAGSVPLQTIDANIDYAQVKAQTKYGLIGIKVWLNKKEEEQYA